MNKKLLKSFTLLLILNLSLFAQGTKEAPKQIIQNNIITAPTSYVDSMNREITIPQSVNRVISLGPNLTEIIAALKPEALVGRTDYCTYPEWVEDIPSIGKISSPNIEKIIDLEPDLVVGSTHVKKEVIETLEKAGITTANLYNSTSIEESYQIVLDMGTLLNKSMRAEAIVNEMKNEMNEIETAVSGLNKPKVYYVVGFGQWGEHTAGGDTFIGKMINLAGGENIAEDVSGWTYSLEKLIEADPDIIVISKYFGSYDKFKTTEPYSDLRAVKEGHLYTIDNNKLDRQGIRNAEGTMDLAKIFHPEAFN